MPHALGGVATHDGTGAGLDGNADAAINQVVALDDKFGLVDAPAAMFSVPVDLRIGHRKRDAGIVDQPVVADGCHVDSALAESACSRRM